MLTGLCQTALCKGILCDVGKQARPDITVSYRTSHRVLGKAATGVEAGLPLRQRVMRDFRRRSECGIESRLFRFKVVDPLFQIGYGMFGFFHRAIFSIDGQRRRNRPGKIENPSDEESDKQRPRR